MPPAGSASVIDGTMSARADRAIAMNSSICLGVGVRVGVIASTPVALNQNGRHLAHRPHPLPQVGQRVVERPVRGPGVERDVRPGRRRRVGPADEDRHAETSARTTPRTGSTYRRRCRSPPSTGVSASEEGGEVIDADSSEGLDDGESVGRGEGDDMGDAQRGTPGSERGGNSGRRILDGHTVARVGANLGGRLEIRLGIGLAVGTSSPVIVAVNEPSGAASTTEAASRRHAIVTSTHGIPAERHAASSSRAPGRHGMCSATRARTQSRSASTICGGSRSTPPRSRSWTAASSRSDPTRECASASVQTPPWSATSVRSHAIQYGSVSTSVPSMSQKIAAGVVTLAVCRSQPEFVNSLRTYCANCSRDRRADRQALRRLRHERGDPRAELNGPVQHGGAARRFAGCVMNGSG